MLSRKLMAAAACMTEVASARTMAAEMAAVWWAKKAAGRRGRGAVACVWTVVVSVVRGRGAGLLAERE